MLVGSLVSDARASGSQTWGASTLVRGLSISASSLRRLENPGSLGKDRSRFSVLYRGSDDDRFSTRN